MTMTLGDFVKEHLEEKIGLAEIYTEFSPEQYERLFKDDFVPDKTDLKKLNRLSGVPLRWWEGVYFTIDYINQIGEKNGN